MAEHDIGWTNERTPAGEDEFETETRTDEDGSETVIIRPRENAPALAAN